MSHTVIVTIFQMLGHYYISDGDLRPDVSDVPITTTLPLTKTQMIVSIFIKKAF